MGFLKKIFKKKPGGTLVGNIFRGAASKITGGISDAFLKAPALGSAPAPTPEMQQATQIASSALGTMANNKLAPLAGGLVTQFANNNPSVVDAVTGALVTSAKKSLIDQAKEWFNKNLWVLLFPVAGLAYFIYKKYAKPSKPARRRN